MKYRYSVLLFVLFISVQSPIKSQQIYPFQNKNLPVKVRVKDLLSRMSLHEKILQMQHLHDVTGVENLKNKISYGCAVNTNLTAQEAAKVYATMQQFIKDSTRWGIPLLTCTEALHGAYQGNSTVYPQALALGSTFNPNLVKQMAAMIVKDLKSMNIKQVLTPDLDLARELRWGRVEETYGEDPFLNAEMGVAYVKTMTENKIICTPKHYVAHGSPWGGLNLASVAGGEQELRSLYLYDFARVIREAKPLSIMNCYSSYDWHPVASSHYLLTDVLRKELGFEGYVYSDWGSVEMLRYFHKTAKDNTDAALQAVSAGLDLEAAGNCYLGLEKLVTEKKLDERIIDTAVYRILYVKFASGLFDEPVNKEYDANKIIHSPESIALAKQIADESIVLLKNEKNILPLNLSTIKSIAVIGPNADFYNPGDYSWTRKKENGVTALQGIKNFTGNSIKINYSQGCDGWSQNKTGFNDAVTAANQSDIVLVFVGTQSGPFTDKQNATSGEGHDLSDLKLPGVQQELIEQIKATGKPFIVILLAGKPLAIPFVKDNANAVLVQWYGGEQQGNAIADVLFGPANGGINPSGKLNVSFPQSVGQLPCYYNYLPSDKGFYNNSGNLEKPGQDYVFSNPKPLWAFGEGLSYTNFNYEDVELSKEKLSINDTLTIKVKVKNTGNMDGKEVVQLYVRNLTSNIETPVQQLKAFMKQFVKVGETSAFILKLPAKELSVYNAQTKKMVNPSEYELQIGSASNDIKIKKTITVY